MYQFQNCKPKVSQATLQRSHSSSFEKLGVTALCIALVLVVFEGALRKWVPGFQGGLYRNLAYFSKDIAFGIAALALISLPRTGRGTPFGKWLFPAFGFLALGAALSNQQGGWNLVGALLSLRALVYLPLIAYLVADRLPSIALKKIALLVVAMAMINFLLSNYQNQLPSDHILNKYATDTGFVVEDPSGVRATGTFAYITGLSVVSSVGIWAGLVLLGYSSSWKNHLFEVVGILSGVGCALASVSRAPIVVGVLMIVGWLILSRSARHRAGEYTAVFCVVIGLFLTPYGSRLQEMSRGLMERHEIATSGNETFSGRAFGQFGELWHASKNSPLGRGLGSEQIGGNYASKGEMSFTTYESQFPRIIMETGLLGFVGFVLICAGALYALEQRKKEVGIETRDSLLATQLLLLSIFYGSLVFNHTASALAWIIFAVAMATGSSPLPRLAREQQTEQRRIRGARPSSRRAGAYRVV